MMTETNAKPIELTCSMCPSYPRIQAELDRLTAKIAEKDAEIELFKNTIEIQEGEIKGLVRERYILCKFKKDNYVKMNELEATIAEKEGEIADLRESISRAADAWIECTGYSYPACAEININKLRRELAEAQNIAASRLEVVEKRGKELLAIHKALSGNVNDPDPLHSSPYYLSYPTTYGLVAGIIRERDKLRNLAASRLADQEAIDYRVNYCPSCGGYVRDIERKGEL